jgi:hypothetical protein
VDAPRLEGERIVLRELIADDTAYVAEIRSLPGVARWWGARDDAYFTAQPGTRDFSPYP